MLRIHILIVSVENGTVILYLGGFTNLSDFLHGSFSSKPSTSRDIYILREESKSWEKLSLYLPFGVGNSQMFVPMDTEDYCNGKKFYYQKPRTSEDVNRLAEKLLRSNK